MMKRKRKNPSLGGLICLLAFCCQAPGVSAQSSADAGVFSQTVPDAVTAALGGNGTALAPDAASVFKNPAQGALAADKRLLGYSVSPWMPGWSYAEDRLTHHLGGVFAFGGRQALLAGARYVRLPGIELTDEQGQLQGNVTPYALEVNAGYAFALWTDFSLGAALRYVRLDQKIEAEEHVALDLSFFYRHPASREDGFFWQAGGQVGNLGKAYLPLKIEYALGGGRTWGAHRVTLTGGVSHRELADGFACVGHAGAEYAFLQKAFLRCGYQGGDRDKGIYSFTSLGCGGVIYKFRLDAAWRLASAGNPQKDTWMVTLGVAF